MITGKLWPAHPHPYHDELLSSWLVRIAHANGVKVQTFCTHEFRGDKEIWNRDVDRLAPSWLVESMALKTGTALDRAWGTTLLGYEGKLYDRYHSASQLRWILPLQLYHRKRRGYGIQYCPSCLAETSEPYYRRAWRVALFSFCPKHDVMLLDRCPECGAGIAFHRLELGRPDVIDSASLQCCWACGFDLSLAPKLPLIRCDEVYQVWRKALLLIENGDSVLDSYDYSTLAVLHHLCAVIVSVRNAQKLMLYVQKKLNQAPLAIDKKRMVFEQHTLAERHHVLGLAWWLLGEWPLRLEAAWKDKAVRYNVLEKDFYDAPKWYLEAVERFVGRGE